MLSKSQISFIKSLHHKKFRKEHQLFIVEGIKSITEFIHSPYNVQSIYCVTDASTKFTNLKQKQKVFEITTSDLQKISALQTPQEALAVVEIPQNPESVLLETKKITLVLDGIQDPGNLGTIIRTADWFGFDQIICSENTVEAYNPKVVQATMGSLSRVKINYLDLPAFLKQTPLPKIGTLLNGKNLYQMEWPKEGLLVLGSEGQGISEEVKTTLTEKVTIPGAGHTESLNVGVAAAICCSEIKRNSFK